MMGSIQSQNFNLEETVRQMKSHLASTNGGTLLDSFLTLSKTDQSQVRNYFSKNPSGILSPILERTLES